MSIGPLLLGDDTYILEIKDITLTPPMPVPGEDLVIEAVGYLKETVDQGASANVLVKLGVVTLLHKDFDICGQLEENDTELKCPIEDGLIKVLHTCIAYEEENFINIQILMSNQNMTLCL